MQSHFIDYQGARLHYQTGGVPHGAVMVLLHGGLGSIGDFDALLPRLQTVFRIVAIDTRGHGRSTLGTAALSYAQAAADVRHILHHLGIGCYGLFGFSDGGTTAYRLGVEDDRVQQIITVGADWHRAHVQAHRPLFEGLDVDFVRENMPVQLAAYLANNPEADAEQWLAALRGMWLDESHSGYPDDSIRRIKAPVLAMRGEADFLYAFADWAALRDALPDVHLMQIPFAAHEAIQEQADMVWAAVQAFQQAA